LQGLDGPLRLRGQMDLPHQPLTHQHQRQRQPEHHRRRRHTLDQVTDGSGPPQTERRLPAQRVLAEKQRDQNQPAQLHDDSGHGGGPETPRLGFAVGPILLDRHGQQPGDPEQQKQPQQQPQQRFGGPRFVPLHRGDPNRDATGQTKQNRPARETTTNQHGQTPSFIRTIFVIFNHASAKPF
jgi:hypothetical protein